MGSGGRFGSGLARLYRVFRGGPDIPFGAKIGSNVHIGNDVRMDWTHGHLISIDDEVTLADGVRILCHDAASNRRIDGTWVAPVRIGARAYIGADAIVLPGVAIGPDAVIAAGAVVSHDVTAGTVVAGVPAREIGTTDALDEERTRLKAEVPVFSASNYAKARLSDEEMLATRRAAAEHGGYFVAKRGGDHIPEGK